MTAPEPLEVLGRDSGPEYAVAFRRGNDETTATTTQLATARRRVALYGCTYIDGFALDEADVDSLIKADARADLPLWPVEVCRHCDTEATVLIEGHPHCPGHAEGYRMAEEASA